ncbi:Pyridoxal phosphate-dependent transferase major region subdomain 2 [Penicillium cf. griseofulvum]|uniref:Pyridoxal phosphate-dependent transferase major region subdomain 2 n=1 Tax=Penicillium cf. griseofulvum TaxID=2972120 RepID=A0A9W9J3B5_9EURO|nr:Pyridoxal phosphate-dependent transferase major region subdomain 2 [Penicillium cf. griseofulvum]KAJ5434196.1 Pyridoxal phosphate-dependent transferase major region subdomain 2 [Penicillium cf. griseofulvum]KAJ5452021.1 Pyridoxal phosphate-dependent transferase major region subdomain 2 [Penicillium cf. griseofulvum]
MPRRFSSNSSNDTSSNPPSFSPASGKGGISIKAPTVKTNRLSQLFSSSPKSKTETVQSGHSHPNNSSPPISLASLSLPTISLSTATADNPNMDELPTTLFQPPSPEEARRLAKQHAQFGPIGHPSHRYSSQHPGGVFPEPVMDEPPYYYLLTTYISYLILIAFGHVRDFFGKRFREEHYRHLKPRNGYGALNSDFDNFYVRRLKLRINDCFERPVTGVPGRTITLIDRGTDDHNQHFYLTGTTTDTLNLSSYNYLGFAQSDGPCADLAEETIKKYGIAAPSTRAESGTQDLHVEVEELVARFVGKESSMIFSMGFGTNATVFPALVSKGCLLISDELNHASIRFGARLSGASIAMFKHNDMKDLELRLREAISQGQPRTHRPWKKILVVVEGLYSMEGSMCNLPGLVQLKRRYKFNLFVDEAHSIGAIGPKGRGVCDYFSIDTSEVDILMGTLTKSFGANGGYIAADKVMIDQLRATNPGVYFGESPAPAVLSQIASALRIISGELVPGQGEERLQRLAFNSRYLRLGLKRLGFIVYGHDDSPIVPLLLFNPAKMPAFSHEMLRRKISVVVVGYPATPLVSSRARFCVSAAHTKDDLDRVLTACDEIGNVLQLKFSTGIAGGALPAAEQSAPPPELEKEWHRKRSENISPPRWRVEDVIRRGVQDVKNPLY